MTITLSHLHVVIYVVMLSLICNLISALSSPSPSWDLPNVDDLGHVALRGRGAIACLKEQNYQRGVTLPTSEHMACLGTNLVLYAIL